MRAPFGVILLGIVALAAGIGYIVMGLQMTTAVTFGPLQTGSGAWFWGWVIVITGVIFVAAAFALWALQPWAWMLAFFLAIFGVIEAIFALLGTGSLDYAMATTFFPLLILWYLHREPIKKAFGLTDV
jgi:hypothetical protein